MYEETFVLTHLPEAAPGSVAPHPEPNGGVVNWRLRPAPASQQPWLFMCSWLQGVLDTGKKLSDDNTIGKEEIQQRLAQFVEHWKELKQLATARWVAGEGRDPLGLGGRPAELPARPPPPGPFPGCARPRMAGSTATSDPC